MASVEAITKQELIEATNTKLIGIPEDRTPASGYLCWLSLLICNAIRWIDINGNAHKRKSQESNCAEPHALRGWQIRANGRRLCITMFQEIHRGWWLTNSSVPQGHTTDFARKLQKASRLKLGLWAKMQDLQVGQIDTDDALLWFWRRSESKKRNKNRQLHEDG